MDKEKLNEFSQRRMREEIEKDLKIPDRIPDWILAQGRRDASGWVVFVPDELLEKIKR